MANKTIALAATLTLASCNWPFDYSSPLEWPGGAPEGCGNGVLDPDETCDDGNRRDGDDCSANCFETPVLVLNSITEGAQYFPDLAGGPHGLLLGYTSDEVTGIDDDAKHVRVALLTDVGRPQPFGEYAWDMRMNTDASAAFSQEQASVGMYGEYIVAVWMDLNRATTTGPGDIRVRKADMSSSMGDAEVIVNETVDGTEIEPALASNGASTTMLAAWVTNTSAPTDVLCRLIVEGLPSGSEFSCSVDTDGDESQPAAAMSASGTFAVAWTSGPSVFLRLFGTDGTALTGDIQVSSPTGGVHDRPAVAFDAGGRLIVVWRDTSAGGEPRIRARLYDSSGTAVGSDFVVSVAPMMTQEDTAIPDVAGDAGVFIVVWYSNGHGIRGRLVSGQNSFAVNRINPHPVGQPFTDSSEFPVTGDLYRMREATVAVSTPGKALVAWVDDGEGTGSNIRGRIIPTN